MAAPVIVSEHVSEILGIIERVGEVARAICFVEAKCVIDHRFQDVVSVVRS